MIIMCPRWEDEVRQASGGTCTDHCEHSLVVSSFFAGTEGRSDHGLLVRNSIQNSSSATDSATCPVRYIR